MTGRFDLTGRRAVVTGAARGLGAAFATGLAEAGADLVLIDRADCAETMAAVRALGREVVVYQADLAETERLADLADRIRSDRGPVHILLNNAGIARLEHFNEITVDAWRAVQRINVDAVFFLAQRFAEHMIADGVAGRIINISSKNGLVAEAGLAHYNTSKGAVELLTKSLAAELGPHGVTVNSVAPGMIETGIADDFPADLVGLTEAWRARIPLRQRYGTPDECVGAVLLLASDAGAYITGTHILVDGGALADQMPRLRFLPPYRNTIG